MQTLKLANLILDSMERPAHVSYIIDETYSYPSFQPATQRYPEEKIDWVFNIEESTLTNPDLEAAVRQYNSNHLRLLLKVVKMFNTSAS
jgi:hypothetical protein